MKNITQPFVQRVKILLLFLHLKLWLAKQSVKALTLESKAFQYISLMFPNLSKAKPKDAIFIGSHTKNLSASKELEKSV